MFFALSFFHRHSINTSLSLSTDHSHRSEPTVTKRYQPRTDLFEATEDDVRRKREQQDQRRKGAGTPPTTVGVDGGGDQGDVFFVDVDGGGAPRRVPSPRGGPARPGRDGPLRLAIRDPYQLRRSL